jgi:glycosyltransferase involved in cell wall biosynthesis
MKKYYKLYCESVEESLKIGNKNIDNVKNDVTSSISTSSTPTLKSLYAIVVSPYVLFKIMKEKCSAVHFTTAHFDNIALATLLCIFTNIKIVFSIHDYEPHPGTSYYSVLIYNHIVTHILADEVLFYCPSVESRKTASSYQKLGGFRQKIKKPKSGNYILTVGRMKEYKGIDNLYKIATESDRSFVVAGKGDSKYLKKIKKMENTKVINKFIKKKKLLRLYRKASICLLPYKSATQSGVILMSYAHATPVMVTNVGCLRHYVDDDTGWIFENNKEIIRKLKSLEQNEIVDKSQTIIEKYQKNFGKDKFKKDYKDIIKKYQKI